MTGGLLIALDKLFRLSDAISRAGVIPFYLDGVVATILSPMLLGAMVALLFTIVRTRVIPAQAGNWPPTWTLEAMLFGAVGAVAWWVVPVALFLLMWHLLFFTSSMLGVIVMKAAESILGSQSNVPYRLFDWGMYLGGALGGGVVGWRIGEFLVGLVRELSGRQAWANRRQTTIGMLVGIALGIAYGVVFVRFYMMELWMNW